MKLNVTNNSVVLSEKLLTHLNVRDGDSLFAVESENGIYLIPYNSELAKQIRAGEAIIDKYGEALRKLAK